MGKMGSTKQAREIALEYALHLLNLGLLTQKEHDSCRVRIFRKWPLPKPDKDCKC